MRCIFLVREGIGVSGVKKTLEKKKGRSEEHSETGRSWA